MIPPKPTSNQATSIRLQQNKKDILNRQKFTQQIIADRNTDRNEERAKNRSFAIREASLEARNAKRIKKTILTNSGEDEGFLAASSDLPQKINIQSAREANMKDLNASGLMTSGFITPGGNLATLDPITEQ